ncbi:Stk1 family PASTA domain-containing Ser/Thr kinase [Companilactobacillus kimchii]|uniref:non-specific serine/threonine protein kinase n=2 Tax=Companilactobacillus kimchii TaxID=2801452 RepID=A0ABR5NQD6_9LACO|nr:Stk1 family PASTA domain-containing Ser/Thr kinase [Companilactobacillus kimchii]KAE9562836.1 serine/threonine protein kinase [Companilactobacillus kimchii]KRK49869.1 serine threonine protein kinase [Companilactobacillus kimchii DSM 13961 = JCM 10707]OWF33164.1 Non-specific serine/threonine protein kinase [Companilactobacillus kimchii]GEO46751.1 serine/threonine protein kinase [Companilactobacillus paralimentarius]
MEKGYLVDGRYEILGTLGEGGMANVYLANDTLLNRKVAVKALRYDLQDDESVKRRFAREAKATSGLSNPNIVNVLDVGNDKGVQYIVIEYVDGPNLKKYIRTHFPIPYHEVVDIMKQICMAVSDAHEHGIIHRDLKPENILVDESKDPIQVKVSDFGIALALSERSITRTNSLLGSVHYMSPEQIKGRSATVLSDIYALGIILFELLTKHVPFTGDTAVTVALKHSKEDMPDLRKIDPDIPQPLENAVLKATAKDPDQRYQSVREMCDDLNTCLMPERADEPKFIPTPINNLEETRVMEPLTDTDDDTPVPKHQTKKLSKKRKIILLASLVPLILILFVIAMVIKSNQETTVPDLYNLTVKQATVMLKSSNLQVGDLSRENDDDVEAGHVIKSIPAKGLKLKNSAQVNLVVSLGATYYKMPKLVGKQYEDVSDNLKKRGFKVKIEYKATNEYVAGTILKQSIPKGKKVVTKNKSLTLTLAKIKTVKPKMVKVRDLDGYNLKSIQDYASETGLSLNVSYQYSDDVESGLLISQNPAANSTINQGGTLAVVISKGKDPDKSTSTNKDDSDSSDSNNDSSSSSTSTVTKDITIPYDAGGNNSVTIYISDATHNIGTVYKTMTITQDTPVTLSFNLKDGQTGSYVVERDNKTVLGGSVK